MTTTYLDRAHQLDAQGFSPDEIRAKLMNEGAPVGLAEVCSRTVAQTTEAQDDASEQSGSDIIVGLMVLVGGILITALSYNVARPGGSYVITYGAIVYGAVRVLKGLANS